MGRGKGTYPPMKRILFLLLCLLSFLVPVRADEINVSSELASVINGTSNSTAGTEFKLTVADWVLVPRFVAAGVGTSNVTFGVNLRLGTNWTTTLPLSLTAACNGTTAVVGSPVYVARSNLVGVSALRLDQIITTQTNAVTISGLSIYR